MIEITPQFLYTLATEYLGFKEFSTLHKYLCERLCKPREHYIRMWLLPRGFFKTSLFTYTHNTALALADPNVRILQVSGVLANAKAMVSKIGKTFTHNELFRDKYPDYCPKNAETPNTKWTEATITLPNRTAHHAEGTFEAMGVDSTIVSRHYDYMKFDDLVTPENSTTKDQLQKIIDFFEECQALADRRGFTPVDVYGTTWDDGDLYAYLKEKPGIEVITVPATYQKGRKKTVGINLPYKEGETIFPERYPTQDLKQFEKDDPHTYAMFYDLDPVPLGDRTFTDFTYYDDLPGAYNEYRKFMTVDPAPTKNPTSSYSAISITAASKINMYVLLSWRDKINPNILIDKMWDFYFKYECEAIGIETDVYQIALKYWLMERMTQDEDHRFMKIVELKARGKVKEDRIAALSPYVNTGKIKFKKNQKDLVWELSRFPKASTRDLADALAYQLYIFKPSLYKNTEKERPGSLDMWKRRMGKMKDHHRLAGHYIGH